MNKKGTVIFFALMLAVVFFLLGLALAPALTEVVDESMTRLDCTNSSISSFDKGTCTIMDLNSPLFIAFIFSLAGGILGGIIVR